MKLGFSTVALVSESVCVCLHLCLHFLIAAWQQPSCRPLSRTLCPGTRRGWRTRIPGRPWRSPDSSGGEGSEGGGGSRQHHFFFSVYFSFFVSFSVFFSVSIAFSFSCFSFFFFYFTFSFSFSFSFSSPCSSMFPRSLEKYNNAAMKYKWRT